MQPSGRPFGLTNLIVWRPAKALLLFLFISFSGSFVFAQAILTPPTGDPKAIAVEEVISDKKIQRRLVDIFTALGSYENVQVSVFSGVVILAGLVEEEAQIDWAHDLAMRMDGVVAVQNQLVSRPQKIFDLSLAKREIEGFNEALMVRLPSILLSFAILAIAFILFLLSVFGFRRLLASQIPSALLLSATAKIFALPIFLLGVYFALRISGLTGLAFTVLGGTGILGLALGLGLKNSFEDYVASIFLSIKKPFRPSDWIKIGESEGIVQAVTSRSTVIIDFSGNHILIPNSLVYKSVIKNMSANPKMRSDFVFGLDYGDAIEVAQVMVMEFLAKSKLVLKDPEPWILVDRLGNSSVSLRVYFWINAREVSVFKITSHLMLEIKNLLLENGFRFPDPAREIVFANQLSLAQGVIPSTTNEVKIPIKTKDPESEELRSEISELNRQARESDLPDQGENII